LRGLARTGCGLSLRMHQSPVGPERGKTTTTMELHGMIEAADADIAT